MPTARDRADEDAFVNAELDVRSRQLARVQRDIELVSEAIIRSDVDLERVSRERGSDEQLALKRGSIQTRRRRQQGTLDALLHELSLLQREAHAETFWKIRRVPQVQRVYMLGTKSEWMVIMTRPLYGRLRRVGTWHRIGSFMITVYHSIPEPGLICFKNLDGVRAFQSDYRVGFLYQHFKLMAPTGIPESGYPGCFGTAKQPLEQALLKRDWSTAVRILVRFPECTGLLGHLRYWPRVPLREVPRWYLRTQFDPDE